MPKLNLKPTHKAVRDYYESLEELDRVGAVHEGAVRSAFKELLSWCGRKLKMTLVQEYPISLPQNRRIVVDGALKWKLGLVCGFWEAKDVHDDLEAAVKQKFRAGYPSDNIIFQTPERAILWQNGIQVLDADLTDRKQLIKILQWFFAHRPPEIARWEEAVAEFKDVVPDIGREFSELIKERRRNHWPFTDAFSRFHEKCRLSINPNLSEAAVEEMLIQHLMTERIFRTVFNNPDFTRRNVIASEIEDVIMALTSQHFSRDEFLQGLDRFYVAIERTADTITDYSQKQHFLNTVYEQFFQGFSVRVADTHGIVYTPQPIVDFIVRSVEHILVTEFDRALSDAGIHIIDPFVGTGNFIVRIMRGIPKTKLEKKYKSDLHCNEVMLLPYYIANMNIEHEFLELAGQYQPFEGLCLVDTFELAEGHQTDLFTAENTARVGRQQDAEMFVIIGNPPYNMGQVNENDNNKNRKYKTIDKRIAKTYATDSTATLRNKLYDPYVKAIRWASDRIGDNGVVAFVTNNGFLDGIAFDGMRKHLAEDYDLIYVLDLGGNARRGLEVSQANVFDIRVGVSINLFVRISRPLTPKSRILYHQIDEKWNKMQKFRFLKDREHIGNIEWRTIQPDLRITWLTEGLCAEFDTFIALGTREAKKANGGEVIFRLYSYGVVTSRDALVYSFDLETLKKRVHTFIEIYNSTVDRRKRIGPNAPVEEFIDTNDPRIKWSRQVKASLRKLEPSAYEDRHFRTSLYRPFTRKSLYFDNFWNEERYQQLRIFPTPEAETENRVIWLKVGQEWPMFALMINKIPEALPQGGSQCFPFYSYDGDEKYCRENITDWALEGAHFKNTTETRLSQNGQSSTMCTPYCTTRIIATGIGPT